MKCVLVILALVGLAAAGLEQCKFDEKKFSAVRQGPRSKAEDDAEAFASCQKDETLVACACEPFEGRDDDCDGSMFRTQADGDFCVAKNGANGKGVVAKAACQRSIITCETSYNNMPSIRCPKNFKLMHCTMHSSFMHMYPAQPIKPRVKRDGGLCKTTKGCESCKVQARCIRVTGF